MALGRATHVRDWTEAGAFIGFAEPLPTGTRVELRVDGQRKPATIEEVIESADPAVAGMRVRFAAEGAPVAVAAEPSVPETSEAHAQATAPSEPHAPEAGEPSGPNAGAGGGKRRRRRR